VDLPEYLDERLVRRTDPRPGGHVAVWLRMAVRAHDNPALDAGIFAAHHLGLPLLVCFGLPEQMPHASDRHHVFALQGARDLAADLAARGIQAVFHVQCPKRPGRVIEAAADNAALVVTDAFPLGILRRWTEALAAAVPTWEVDATCIVPMTLTGDYSDDLDTFRAMTAEARGERIGRPWPAMDLSPAPGPVALDFDSLDLASTDLAELVGACTIDHGVAPSRELRGGRVAGEARWAAFRDGPLADYGHRRYDAADAAGVRRIQAHLAHGHLSPFQVAREAHERGATAFLDDTIVAHDMAWHFCHHRRDAGSWTGVPEWTRNTLKAHTRDPRDPLPLQRLSQGVTGDALWNAAQASLVLHGELHPSLVRTWAKSILRWSSGPERAMARMFLMYGRYALDGNDPAAVATLLGALGAFDAPAAEQPIFGVVPGDDRSEHARLDLDTFNRHARRPVLGSAPRVLVVGAGLAGVTAASLLAQMGVDVEVVDKSRGPGGRLSTRRAEKTRFDHGCQDFVAHDPRFAQQVRRWMASGFVTPARVRRGYIDRRGWHIVPAKEPRYVATPKMSILPRRVLGAVPSHLRTEVSRIAPDGGAWRVWAGDEDLGLWDRVLVTAPAPQAACMLVDAVPELVTQLTEVQYDPCWSVMIWAKGTMPPLDVVHFDRGSMASFHRQDVLPGRDGPPRWVAQGSAEWTRENLELDKETAGRVLASGFMAVTDLQPTRFLAHRWRYARVATPMGVDHIWDRGIGIAGDACLGSTVEQVWLSGVAAAGALLRELVAHE
jgi:predicted NAD/FAD-dependent oxidoreductase/deoxyribodipyrimidine photolyase